MHASLSIVRDWRSWLIATISLLAGLLLAAPAFSAHDSGEPLATYTFLARSDNPVDALAASSVAAQLGAPIFLTPPTSLAAVTREGLVAADPDIVILAGGTAALSDDVATAVAQALPGAQVRRVSGDNRMETAKLLNDLPGEIGLGRPVITGVLVDGDVSVAGTIHAADTDLSAELADMRDRVAALEALLDGVVRDGTDLRFEGMNVHVRAGTGATNVVNGLGNLVIGYNETAADDRGGSHNLVIGRNHTYTAWGSIVAGENHASTASLTALLGGIDNTASGFAATVAGGRENQATGQFGGMLGGRENTIAADTAVVIGGSLNGGGEQFGTTVGGHSNGAFGRYGSSIGNEAFPDSEPEG